MVGKLERVPLREVFPHEARSLTKWLAENPDVISDVIEKTLTIKEREGSVGDFAFDLLAEDDEGNLVVVENQLERSNHDHLGKVITYVSGRDAKCAVWIVSDPRPEHITAVNWLNEAGLCTFYLLKIEAVRIGASDPAPLLTQITAPSDELLISGEEKKDQVQRHVERVEFWTVLLPISNKKTALFLNVSAGPHSYLWASAGHTGIGYVYRVTQHDVSVELYLGGPDRDRNTANFQLLRSNSEEITREFGGELEWDEMGDAKACRIRQVFHLGGYRAPKEEWAAIADTAASAMMHLELATRKFIRSMS